MKFKLFFLVGLFGLLGLACNATTAVTPTATPLPPPQATIVAPTAVVPLETPPPPAVTELDAPATPTTVPVDEVTAQPPDTPSSLPTAEPIEPGRIAPGQQVGETIAEGETAVYTFAGTQFQPVMFFVEDGATVDLTLAAYDRADPAGASPVAQADFSAAGGPEIFVVTPQKEGDHALVVSSQSGAGNYNLYMFDGVTQAANTVVKSDSLAAGQVKVETAVSNGGRPVLIFVDPTDQSNVAISVDGGATAEADYAGNGSAEALFLLPLQTTTYEITISESNGGASSYHLVIVTL